MFGQPLGKPWYFDSTSHTEALNRLIYVAEQGEAFVLLMAEHGAGKTTVLNRVLAECRRAGQSGVVINVAALDEQAFLWHLCGGLSISPRPNQGRSELMTAIRDEISGRALCNHRTVVILDDLHLASEDLILMVQFLTALNEQNDGAVCVVAAAEHTLNPAFDNQSVLKVRLPLLSEQDARNFTIEKLRWLNVDADQCTEDAVEQIVEFGAGSPSQLTRICEVVQVAAVTSPNARLTAESVYELTTEALSLSSVA